MMRLRAPLLVFAALIIASGTVRAVDRGQFEDVPDDIHAWFKGVRSPSGIPCCDISDGHRTIYEVREGGYWEIDGAWWRVPEKAVVRNAGNPLGEAVSGMLVFAAILKSVALFQPMPVSGEICCGAISARATQLRGSADQIAISPLVEVYIDNIPSPGLS